jgi:hypothetical protein
MARRHGTRETVQSARKHLMPLAQRSTKFEPHAKFLKDGTSLYPRFHAQSRSCNAAVQWDHITSNKGTSGPAGD